MENTNPLSNTQKQSHFQTTFLGSVSNIGGSLVTFIVDQSRAELAKNTEMGSYALIKHKDLALLGQISRMKTCEEKEEHEGTLELLATIDLEKCKLIPGISRIPGIESPIYIASPELIQALFAPHSMNNFPEISIGNLSHDTGPAIGLSPDMLFSRHCAILGSTGGGKSNSLSTILEECLKYKSKMILIDATGEYKSFSGKYVKHVHIGKASEFQPEALNSKEVAVPYYHLTESDLTGMFKPSGQAQAPKLRAAMKSLKLGILCPSLQLDGYIIKADKDRRFYDTEFQRHTKALNNPLAIFDISKLPQQIENECVKPTRSPTEPYFWGALNPIEQAYCTSLVIRVADIINSPELACIFNPAKLPSLLDEIAVFIDDPDTRLLRISLESLPFVYNTRELVCNAIGRQVLHLARAGRFKEVPICLFVDEAHHFLKEHLEDDPNLPSIDSMALIAKEGRKYGVALCLATQRPRDLPESILSQMGTYLIHRISNPSDRKIIESASGSCEHGTLEILPTLRPGKCIILGNAVPFPLIVQVRRPNTPPFSESPSFVDHWRL